MGYKNKTTRSDWEKKNRSKYAKQYKARHRANEVHKIAQECSFKGCKDLGERHHPDYDKPDEIIWLCNRHHKEIHGIVKKKCSMEECFRVHHAKSYCKLHYNRWKRRDPVYHQEELRKNREYKLHGREV